MLFQRFEQRGSEAEVAFLKLFGILRPVYAGKVKNEITVGAEAIQVFLGVAPIILIDFLDRQSRSGSVFSVSDVFQVLNQVSAHKTCGASN
jgi:hypothetical protein